jgi:hypothetical protein
MADKSGFVWVQPPSNIAKGVADYAHRCEAALYAIASKWGQDVQNETRINAAWEDRTGNARSGLFYAVDGLGMGEVVGDISAGARSLMRETEEVKGDKNTLVIVVAHTVFYGKFLELSRGGKYAIILSTIEKNLPRLEQMVQQVFKG